MGNSSTASCTQSECRTDDGLESNILGQTNRQKPRLVHTWSTSTRPYNSQARTGSVETNHAKKSLVLDLTRGLVSDRDVTRQWAWQNGDERRQRCQQKEDIILPNLLSTSGRVERVRLKTFYPEKTECDAPIGDVAPAPPSDTSPFSPKSRSAKQEENKAQTDILAATLSKAQVEEAQGENIEVEEAHAEGPEVKAETEKIEVEKAEVEKTAAETAETASTTASDTSGAAAVNDDENVDDAELPPQGALPSILPIHEKPFNTAVNDDENVNDEVEKAELEKTAAETASETSGAAAVKKIQYNIVPVKGFWGDIVPDKVIDKAPEQRPETPDKVNKVNYDGNYTRVKDNADICDIKNGTLTWHQRYNHSNSSNSCDSEHLPCLLLSPHHRHFRRSVLKLTENDANELVMTSQGKTYTGTLVDDVLTWNDGEQWKRK